MTDPAAVPPQLIVVSSSARLGDRLTATKDEGLLPRLAIWLAEVSAEASLRTPAGEADSHTAEPME
jgi:hypothetical protein